MIHFAVLWMLQGKAGRRSMTVSAPHRVDRPSPLFDSSSCWGHRVVAIVGVDLQPGSWLADEASLGLGVGSRCGQDGPAAAISLSHELRHLNALARADVRPSGVIPPGGRKAIWSPVRRSRGASGGCR